MKTVPIVYFSDVLCIWAYIAQPRVDLVKKTYSDQVRVEQKFCSVFGDTVGKISAAWKGKGEFVVEGSPSDFEQRPPLSQGDQSPRTGRRL